MVYYKRYARTDAYGDQARNMAYISFANQGTSYAVFNLHGICTKTKTDSDARTEQSRIINEVMSRFAGSKRILCGDFNFSPDTQCMAMLENPPKFAAGERRGMINLIKTHNIPTTRNALFPWPDKFADYVLVTPDITINQFEVISNEVSDHLPLVLKFDCVS
jgi:endonuclease/exonuclease/phosphatase family metal-dependent hydrolase